MVHVEQSERRLYDVLEEGAVRGRPRKNADPEQNTEQQASCIIRIDTARHRSVGLSGAYAPLEEGFNLSKLFSDYSAEFFLVGRHLERGVNEKTSLAFPIIDRVLDDLGEEVTDRLFGGQRYLIPAQPIARRAIEVALEGPSKESLLVPEGVIETWRGQTH